uniref:Uncharacterized protein n=1 Tax=Oryza glumipatula TaxID=40148 RepID=A0A0D9ZVY8_9ORYZ
MGEPTTGGREQGRDQAGGRGTRAWASRRQEHASRGEPAAATAVSNQPQSAIDLQQNRDEPNPSHFVPKPNTCKFGWTRCRCCRRKRLLPFANKGDVNRAPSPAISSELTPAISSDARREKGLNATTVFQRIDVVSKDFDNIVDVELGGPWPLPPVELTATLAHKFGIIGEVGKDTCHKSDTDTWRLKMRTRDAATFGHVALACNATVEFIDNLESTLIGGFTLPRAAG